MVNLPLIGILGAGKLGITIGQLARKAGYPVVIAASGEASKIALTVEVLVPGAQVGTAAEVARQADIVILALPLSKYKMLPKEALKGKTVIDAMNYWWEVDGPRDDILPSDASSSEVVQAFLPDAHVVKALNHMGYHDLYDEPRPKGAAGRKAIAIAGDTAEAVRSVEQFIDRLGFDTLYIGALKEGRRLEAGSAVFGANVDLGTLKTLV